MITNRSPTPSIATLSLSGNDIGFANKLTYCLYTPTCYNSYKDRVQIADEIVRQHNRLVEDVYRPILNSDAKLYVLGYPKLFNDSDSAQCALNVRFNTYQRKMANDLVEYFNAVIKSAADHAGAFYVDIENAFASHRLCDGPSFTLAVNGLTSGNDTLIPIFSNGSYHPNAIGHQLLKDAVLEQTNNFTAPMPPPTYRPVPNVQNYNFSYAPGGGETIRSYYYSDSDFTLSYRGNNIAVSMNDISIPTKPHTTYTIELHSDPIILGTVMSNGIGQIEATLPLPEDTPTGIHELHIIGEGEDGQEIDIYQLVYIAESPEDFDGDGIPNQDEPCGIFEPANIDADQDGIDDGCDPFISALAEPSDNDTDTNSNSDNSVPQEEVKDPKSNHKDSNTDITGPQASTSQQQDSPNVLADQEIKEAFIQNALLSHSLVNTGTSASSHLLLTIASATLILAALLLTLFDCLRYAKQ